MGVDDSAGEPEDMARSLSYGPYTVSARLSYGFRF